MELPRFTILSVPVSCIFARASEESHREIILHGNAFKSYIKIYSIIPLINNAEDGTIVIKLLSHVSEIWLDLLRNPAAIYRDRPVGKTNN